MSNRLFYLFLFLLLGVHSLDAKIKLPSILSSNMVLQQNSQIKLWGWSEPNKKIKIVTSWDKKHYKVTANAKGEWILHLLSPEAGGPYKISFDDGDQLSLDNILIGEVWLCSGQSNMEMMMKGNPNQPITDAYHITAQAKKSTPIRIFKVERAYATELQNDCKGTWWENNPEYVSQTSAVAYHFASYLNGVLDVPIGIITTSWGGSKIEAWMKLQGIKKFPEIDLTHLDSKKAISSAQHKANILYNAMLAPLTSYAVKGMIWYQGESNRHNAKQYLELKKEFISQVRDEWSNDTLPFYYVQIAPFPYGNPRERSAAYLREAQLTFGKEVPHTGMVVTLDIGSDICIHPPRKQEVGERLALNALEKTYGVGGFEITPPNYISHIINKDGSVLIQFDKGGRLFSPTAVIEGFEMCGEDRMFHPATGRILGAKGVKVTSNKVKKPIAVRYAFINNPKATLFDLNQLPVSSFRTDDFPLVK